MLLRWESDSRYYLIHVSPDLFGDTTIRRVWGSLDSARGNQMFEVLEGLDCQAEVAHRIERVAKRREQRGYRLIVGTLPTIS
ncbi:hypothetical protein [Nitrogeniibacter aestuarii]|uniref:hypothetical protein n=1 Tax=Nitrogeniibacter aestuarii TaxID=2815343 RepID=UPI001E435699|nr:hypothetical protein [Nitrogeniibacter aestuarii]